MIVKGTAEEIEQNRQGRLAESQYQRLRAQAIYNLPFWPNLLLAPVFLGIGMLKGGTWLWLGLAVALFMLASGLTRQRQQRGLARRAVEMLEGSVERLQPSPIRYVEALLTVAGRELIVASGLPGTALAQGQRYRFYVVPQIARRPVVVAAETVES